MPMRVKQVASLLQVVGLWRRGEGRGDRNHAWEKRGQKVCRKLEKRWPEDGIPKLVRSRRKKWKNMQQQKRPNRQEPIIMGQKLELKGMSRARQKLDFQLALWASRSQNLLAQANFLLAHV